MPKVSVIIPNFNHAAYLAQRIDSVLAQTYQDFEIILLDDCSTDDSKKVMDNYQNHPKVSHTVYNVENSGSTFKQWEKGINLAKGDFIWIAESDDWCEKILLAELVSGLEKEEKCVISYCQSYCINNYNEISWISQHPFLSETVEGHKFIKKYLLRNNSVFNASMVLWKKKWFNTIPKEFITYKFCGDWLFWIEMASHGHVHISGKILNYFRKHDKDVSGKVAKSGLNFVETLKLLNTMYQKNLITGQEYNKAFRFHFRNYRRLRSGLDPETVIIIDQLFHKPASPKTKYFKTFLAAIWHNLRKKN